MQYLSVRLGSALGEIDIGSVESISPLIYNIHSINRLALNMADKLYYLSPSPTTVQPPLYPIYKLGCVFLSLLILLKMDRGFLSKET